MLRLAIILALLMACVACAGDSLLRVRGVVTNADDVTRCELGLSTKTDQRLDATTAAAGDFVAEFVISPRPTDYFIIVRCDGYQAYMTPLFRAPQRRGPIELGAINLVRGENSGR
jgi:hypothetical protein